MLGAGLALAPQAAQAQRARVPDPSGDSSSPATDITLMKVRHTRHRIRAAVTLPHLVPGRLSGTELLIKPRGKKRVYAVTVLRDRQGDVAETSLSWRPLNDPVEPEPMPCRGIRTSLAGQRAVVLVAKSCLTKTGPNRPIRAKVRLMDGTVGLGSTYYNDQTHFTDLLRRAGTAPTGRVTAEHGLVVRGLPTMFSARHGKLAQGELYPLTCKVTGSVVFRDNDENADVSNEWYRLAGRPHAWVSALYMRNVNGAPPYCGNGQTYLGRVTAELVIPREAPTTRANSHGGLFRGTKVTINCKLRGRPVDGNDLWYNLPQGLWVPARYVSNIGAVPGFCTH
ncbi:MAG: hypothetical protein ACTHKG_19890 [Nocardioides sp.]